jgi:hypothetical protein
MHELILALMTWIAAHTGLPVPDRLPEVVFATHCEIQRLAFAGKRRCSETEGAVAAYDHRTRTIYLPRNWSQDNVYHVSMLLHELVHHMQAEDGLHMGVPGICPGRDLEQPAYSAQIAWLKEAGVEDPLAMMGMNALYLVMVTSCRHGN